MRRTLFAALLLLLALFGHAQEPDKDKPSPDLATEITKPGSPKRPAPKWVELVDLGGIEKRLAGYRAPKGIKVEIVAEAPTVVNPVGLTFAEDGTPLVIEWTHDPDATPTVGEETIAYKNGDKRTISVIKKRKKDVLKSLVPGKDGTWQPGKVILEEEMPSTLLAHDGWLYTASRGSVRRHRVSKPGGAYDTTEVIARGFGGLGQHQVSGLTLGPDGFLYISCGDGENDIEGSDGSRARVTATGAIFRCRPDGSKIEVFALGLRNPYRDVAFDAYGHCFHLDNDHGSGTKFTGCRLLHLAEGADYGWRLDARKRGQPDAARAAAFGELPGKMPGLIKTGRGAPAGLLIYNDTRLPETYRGLLFYPDVYRRLIRAYRVEPRGSSFDVVEEFEFLSAPKDELFRPCQMVTGPDGAIYIVDWRTNSEGGGRLAGDGKNGRIYRVTWAGTKEQPALEPRGLDSLAKVSRREDAELTEALSSDEASERDRARRELVKRGDKNRAKLLALLRDKDARLHARLAAIGALAWMVEDAVQKSFLARLGDGDDELKRAAAEALGMWAKPGDAVVQDALLKAMSEDDAAVRRSVILATARLAAPGAADSLATTLSFDEGKDRFLRDALVRAMERLGKEGMSALLSLADSGVQKDTDRVIEAFLAARTKPAFDVLPSVLKHMHASDAQRAELIRSLANYQLDPPISVEPIVTWLAGQKRETAAVKTAMLEILATPSLVRGKKGDEWAIEMLADKSAEVQKAAVVAAGLTSSGAIAAGKRLVEKKLPDALRADVIATLRKHVKDADAAKLLAELDAKR